MLPIFRRPVNKEQVTTVIAGTLFAALMAVSVVAVFTQAMAKAALDLIF
jgi:hypothetical protein